MSSQIRPVGVTILAILEVVSGILGIVGGAFLLGLAEMTVFRIKQEAILMILSLILMIIGFVQLVMAYGLWTAQGWAWTGTLILAVIGAIFAVVNMARGNILGLITLILDLAAIFYLNTPKVRSFFGKGATTAYPASAYLPGSRQTILKRML